MSVIHMIAGKTHSEILSMKKWIRSLWYKTILPNEKKEAMKLVDIEMRTKVSLAYTPERRTKKSKSMAGENNPNFGGLSEEHKIKIGFSWTPERKARQKKDRTGKNNPMYGKTDEKSPNFGSTRSEETKIKMSMAKTENWKDPGHRNNRIGKNHYNWKGGSSFEPYGLEFNEVLKEEIRNRDNYVCQECDKTQEELGRKLDVHHIDYDKMNNKPENLICLCRSCHIKTNHNRKDWIEHFRKIIKFILQRRDLNDYLCA